MLPNLVIAGVPKAGTTSLFNYLASHPAVCGSNIKETLYFTAAQYGESMPPLERYERYFDECTGHSFAMEATPGYVQGGQNVATEIARTLPAVRILIILRDPISRLVSFYRFQKATLQIDADLGIDAYVDRCLAMTPAQLARRGVFRWTGVFGGYYGDHLGPWLETFRERCGIVFFEQLQEDPEGLTDQTLEWLGLDATEREPLGGEVHNRTINPRSRGLQRVGLYVNRRLEPFWHRRPGIKRSIRNAYHRINAADKRDDIPAETQQRIGDIYADSNRRTAALLRDHGHTAFPDWLEEAAANQAPDASAGLTQDATP